MLNGQHAITTDKLMLSPSVAMSAAWGNENQRHWGLLSAIAIQLGAKFLETGQIDSHDALLNFMAKFRQAIGAILNHDPDIGVPREGLCGTHLTDHLDCRYRDQVPEFTSFVKDLREQAKVDTSIIDDVFITLTGELKLNEKTRTYKRSSIMEIQGGFEILHTTEGFGSELKQAAIAFEELSNSALSKEQKKTLLNQILFYDADAMPFDRGSAAIVQMMFHALEKRTLGTYSYFGKSKSAYGKEEGLLFDLVAMLSPNFAAFELYFSNNILVEEMMVNELSIKDFIIERPAMSKEELINEFTLLKNDLIAYQAQLIKARSCVNYERKNKIERLSIFYLKLCRILGRKMYPM